MWDLSPTPQGDSAAAFWGLSKTAFLRGAFFSYSSRGDTGINCSLGLGSECPASLAPQPLFSSLSQHFEAGWLVLPVPPSSLPPSSSCMGEAFAANKAHHPHWFPAHLATTSPRGVGSTAQSSQNTIAEATGWPLRQKCPARGERENIASKVLVFPQAMPGVISRVQSQEEVLNTGGCGPPNKANKVSCNNSGSRTPHFPPYPRTTSHLIPGLLLALRLRDHFW